jgi:putative ABC transport system permease protein
VLALAFRNGFRNKRRSLLTILSVAASLCLLGVLMAIYHSFYFTEPSADQALRLVVRNKVSLANPLPLSYEQRIAQVPGVEAITVFQWFGGTYKDNRDPANFFGRFAVEPDRLFDVYPDYKLPAGQIEAFRRERAAAIVGRKTAERHNFKIGDRVTIVGDIFPVTIEVTVRGIYDNVRDNENLFFHYGYLNELMKSRGASGPVDMAGVFVIRMARPEDATPISRAVDALFRNSPQQTKTETEKAFELSFLAFLGNVKMFFLVITSAVTFTILLVTANTMAMSVRERVREVGVLRTLGFTRDRILALLLGESVVMALVGGAIGLTAAYGVCAMIRRAPSTFADMSRITIPPPVAALCLAVAAMIGVLSCIVPAWGASRKSIVEALRFTD